MFETASFSICIRFKGGPMYWADNEVGLPNLLKTLERFSAKYPGSPYFKPSTLLQQCVKMNIGVQEYYNQSKNGIINYKRT